MFAPSWSPCGASIVLLLVGCATPPEVSLEAKREHVETEIRAWGLAEDAAVEAQRAAVEAAIAGEGDSPSIDSIELRAAVVHESDDKMQMLARLPIENLFGAPALRDARRAETERELAKLEEVTLEQRVALCVPSLDRLVHAERMSIYQRYAERQQALLDWNRELRRAGLLDEISVTRFELAGQVSLARRAPAPPVSDSALGSRERPLAVLPEPSATAPELLGTPDLVREQLLRNHPAVEVHRAGGRGFNALAERERANRLPSLRFVDVGFEPVAYAGDDRQIEARVAFEIPLGRAARASERRYQALARRERSAERAWVEASVRRARAAVEEINRFRRRGADWIRLLAGAEAAEKTADRWWRKRLADPTSIAQLLDEVYDARVAVLAAREGAGHAGCRVLASTGTSVENWPQ